MRHLRACELSAQSAELQLPGTYRHLSALIGAYRRFAVRICGLVLEIGFNLVEQRLVNHPTRARNHCNALTVLHQANYLLLDFERVARP